MLLLKKIVFGVVTFLCFLVVLFLLAGILKSPAEILGLDVQVAINLVLLALLTSLSGGFFATYMALADDWKYGAVLLVFLGVAGVFLLPFPEGLVVGVGTLFGGFIVLWSIKKSLSSYLNWSVGGVLMRSVRLWGSLIFIAIALSFYLASSKAFAEKGFEIPDTLIDPILKMIPTDVPQAGGTGNFQLDEAGIQTLSQNPQALAQFGLKPEDLKQLTSKPVSPANLQNDFIKQTVKSQLNNFIKPIQGYMPGIMAVFLYLTLAGLASILNIAVLLVLNLTFAILKSVKFVKFETETRQIQKLTVG